MQHRSLTIAALLLLPCTLIAQWKSLPDVDSLRYENGATVLLHAGKSVTRVQVLADDLVRIRCVPGGSALGAGFSWAVVKRDWKPPVVRRLETDSAITLASTTLKVVIGRRPLRISFLDSAGHLVNADHPGKGMSQSGNEIRVWKIMPPDEHYFGLGEKGGSFNRRGSHTAMWNSDIPAYGPDTDPLYQSIPFFYGVREGKAYGIFFDNPAWSSFDFGKESRNQYSFGAESGEIDYYFFCGPTPRKILSTFTELVGRMPLPPRWSLGYQQCRWSYTPESRVREIAESFRSQRIPCDVIYLDIDYMEGYRVFTWNARNFPSPERLLTDLARDGFKVVAIIDPGIKIDSSYAAYRSGEAGNHFVSRSDGTVFTGDVWPGRCAFPDFTNQRTRTWWGEQFSGLVHSGIKGWWNDMNEPSVFNTPTRTIDLAAVHRTDFGPSSHAGNHNIYGMQMTRATFEGVRKLVPGERPFVLTRASYAGGQQFAAAWTGDNVASWEHFAMALRMCLSMSISGQPFVGSDIGGFLGYPSGELFARWLQLGIFTPLMRAHSEINEPNKEPWEYGAEFTVINRETINLRYALLPYIYGVMQEAAATGIPAMRPMMFDNPTDLINLDESTQFTFGSDLLVAPVLQQGAVKRRVNLPAGFWYDYWTGVLHAGGKEVSVDAPINRIPFFIRAGAAIPTQQVVQYTSEAPVDPLTILVYPHPSGIRTQSVFYEDDGTSLRFQKGEYLRRTLTQSGSVDSLTLVLSAAEGIYRPAGRSLIFRVLSAGKTPKRVTLNNMSSNRREISPSTRQEDGWWMDEKDGAITIRCPDRTDSVRLAISYR